MIDAPDTGDDDDRILAAEYVLGLMPAAERRAFEVRLGGDAALRAEVAAWAEDFVRLTDDAPEVAPPAALWRGIEAALDTPVTTAPRRRFGLLGYAIGGLLAATLAWVVMTSGLMSPAAPEFTARIAAEDNSLIFAAAYDADTGTLDLRHQTGGHPPGRSLEFWLISEGTPPVSVIVWPDGSAHEVITLPADLAARVPNAVLAISDEPGGGSPTGQPTGAVVAVGQVEAI
jgi:anti-sigma-K factor RskA